jgi:hypothetical protein
VYNPSAQLLKTISAFKIVWSNVIKKKKELPLAPATATAVIQWMILMDMKGCNNNTPGPIDADSISGTT